MPSEEGVVVMNVHLMDEPFFLLLSLFVSYTLLEDFWSSSGTGYFLESNELVRFIALRCDTTDGWTGLYDIFFYDDGWATHMMGGGRGGWWWLVYNESLELMF